MSQKALSPRRILSIFVPISALMGACASDEDPAAPAEEEPGEAPESYEFESRFQDGESSVSYSGQILRHLLISDLTSYIEGLEEEIESNADFDAETVEPALLGYYEFDSGTSGQNPILLATDPAALQELYDDVSTDKDLVGKIAGQDSGGEKDHKDWSSEFVGWSDESISEFGGDISSPDGLARAFFATIAENARLQVNGDPSREGLKTHQTATGLDLAELVQKFLLGAVAFSQGADDYLDEGLDEDNTEAAEDAAYSALEHAWDEGFGYFGASRHYLSQSDTDIADEVLYDANDDGKIDLTSEYNWGASVNAAKRDNGSTTGTDFTAEAMNAFLEGRYLISQEADVADIREQAKIAVLTWEKALAATAVHYINDTLADQAALGTEDYSFDSHATHWSELKGFSLGFQFNPNSPLSDDDFAELHELIGDAPVLGDASEDDLAAYEDNLLAARALLEEAYEFEAEDVENW